MISISLCMIVRNEEEILARCIDTIKDIVDEIIIVDTGSEDKTKDIAFSYSDKVFDFKWLNDFSIARNYSFSKATKEYVMWLDAGDILLENDRNKLIKLKQDMSSDVDIVMMGYNEEFDELGYVTRSCFRERLLKRINNYIWKEEVHEYIELTGKIITSDVSITRTTNRSNNKRNLKIYRKMLLRGKRICPRSLYYYAKELCNDNKFDEAINYYNKFLQSSNDWIEDKINACYELAKCYKYRKDEKNQLEVLVDSIKYDAPRPEICCELGYLYKDKKEFYKAIFWFESALRVNKRDRTWSYTLNDCWAFIPYVELCVCYYETGDVLRAIEYNELAGLYKPDAPVVLYNKKFFSRI
ncbi:MAG: glycosyltransferase family 2 protein [Clostridiaceae bacterium]|nr:glycosyltransferase family 2 protein [Clostridiaceae bacterium]